MIGRPTFSEATVAKARRLLDADRIVRTEIGATYRVDGDHGSYLVVVSSNGREAYCSCPATTPGCSHAAAALLAIYDGREVPTYVADDGNPFDGLTDSTSFEWEVDR